MIKNPKYYRLNPDEANEKPLKPLKWEIEWRNLIPLAVLNLNIPYGIYLLFTDTMWQTCIFTCLVYILSLIGITAGSHKLWTHKAYKAKLPLQIILLILSTIAFQGSVILWCRDHRLHHKFSDTDVDPHNPKRGFFYSHIGWLILKRQPPAIVQGHSIDISDLRAQPLLRFQKKYYIPLALFFSLALPSIIPMLWGEKLCTAFVVAGMLRLIVSLHVAFLINSVGHTWGAKPHDKRISATDRIFFSILTGGEGLHNFHHTFPWDYRNGVRGGYWINITWLFVDLMAKIGWAYDMKMVSDEMIDKRATRTGDGTYLVWNRKK